KDAALVALLSLILLLPLSGFEAMSEGGSLSLSLHLDHVAFSVALIFCGRLGLRLINHGLSSVILAFSLLAFVFCFTIKFPTQFLFTAAILVSLVLAARAICSFSFVQQ